MELVDAWQKGLPPPMDVKDILPQKKTACREPGPKLTKKVKQKSKKKLKERNERHLKEQLAYFETRDKIQLAMDSHTVINPNNSRKRKCMEPSDDNKSIIGKGSGNTDQTEDEFNRREKRQKLKGDYTWLILPISQPEPSPLQKLTQMVFSCDGSGSGNLMDVGCVDAKGMEAGRVGGSGTVISLVKDGVNVSLTKLGIQIPAPSNSYLNEFFAIFQAFHYINNLSLEYESTINEIAIQSDCQAVIEGLFQTPPICALARRGQDYLKKLTMRFKYTKFMVGWIPREENLIADGLAGKARLGKFDEFCNDGVRSKEMEDLIRFVNLTREKIKGKAIKKFKKHEKKRAIPIVISDDNDNNPPITNRRHHSFRKAFDASEIILIDSDDDEEEGEIVEVAKKQHQLREFSLVGSGDVLEGFVEMRRAVAKRLEEGCVIVESSGEEREGRRKKRGMIVDYDSSENGEKVVEVIHVLSD